MVALCFSLQRIRKVFKNLNNDPKVRKKRREKEEEEEAGGYTQEEWDAWLAFKEDRILIFSLWLYTTLPYILPHHPIHCQEEWSPSPRWRLLTLDDSIDLVWSVWGLEHAGTVLSEYCNAVFAHVPCVTGKLVRWMMAKLVKMFFVHLLLHVWSFTH